MSVDLSIVVPVYNEVQSLRPLYGEIAQVCQRLGRSFEVLFVDDGSDDGSGEVLDDLARQDARVVVLHLARNYGQTAALAAGLDHARGEIIVTLDGDGQNDPADIPALLGEMERGYDFVAGWRTPRRDPWLNRRFPSWVANALIGWITGVRLHDYGCTLRAMRREVAKSLRLYGELHRFLPALADDLGARIREIPVHHRPRQFGRSKYGLSRVWRVLLDLLTVKFLSSYSTRPIQIFGSVGALCSLAGFVLTGWLGFERVVLGIPLANRPLVWLGILLILIGLQFITMGLLGELLVRTYHESQRKPIYRLARQPAVR